ncbi:Site-specific recombinase [Acinetobacter marinus]|uniref:Site-specific recombinase n=1 Tax=Acinetobacter marinus TaxID=281375 RepID=A0A1G6GYT4_9GAMM|nr:site-specific recombinase [Acinetobacter marinus]SDB87058.1 Site-specific recombinase [Acinetobacter marinus]
MHIPLQDLLIEMQAQIDQERLDLQLLVRLVDRLRPSDASDHAQINQKMKAFIRALIMTPTAGDIIQRYFLRLLNQYKQVSLYVESGILGSEGFNTQLSQRIGAHFLPLVKDESELKELVGRVFYKKSDRYWLDNIQAEDWQMILHLLGQSNANQGNKHHIRMKMINAIMILSYRVSAIGLHSEFTHAYPEIDEFESPFLIQNREIVEFIETYKKYESQYDIASVMPVPDPDQALVMLEQCRDIMQRVRRATKRIGVSLSLTYLLTLLEQCLQRIEILLHVVTDEDKAQQSAIMELLRNITYAHYSDQSVRALLTTNTELIALQVTENASRTGEHYVSTDKKGYFEMYRAAAGAGAIIAVMATLKILSARLTLAPLMQAFIYSMNYGLGFVFIHILHFTVATKQPAMTAAALAATIQQKKGSKNAHMAELAALIINIIRTQFIAILGNISIAIPVAALIAYGWDAMFGEALMNHAKASHVLHELNPFTSLAIPHAAIAGVCLFFSGLIAGYYDNLAIYRQIGARIKAHPKLQKIFTKHRLERVANYVEQNLGAIMGNFLFGVMLGSMGTIGFILGLPLDIRHIAFASANFIQGLMNINGSPDIGLIVVSFLGVLLIGLTNLFVSFSLTIFVALRARRVRVQEWRPLFKLIATHFVTRPSEFFWPPRKPLQIDEAEVKEARSS